MKLTTKNNYDPFNFFDDFFSPFKSKYYQSAMNTDVSIRKGSYVVDIDIPGFNKDDLKIKLENGYLKVYAESKQNNASEADDIEWLHRERLRGSYSRSFYVGCSDDAKVNAAYHNGVLTIVIPDAQNTKQEKGKYITID